MTPSTINTSNTSLTNMNAVLAMPSISSFDNKKSVSNKTLLSYSITPKSATRKSSFKVSSIDWDLNMNELEFE